MRRWHCILPAALLACGGTPGIPGVQLSCGPGTVQTGNECFPLAADAGSDAGSDAGVRIGAPVGDDAGTADDRGSEATNFGIDAAHHNAQEDDAVASPLSARWTLQLAGPPSFPLSASGLVFVAVASTQPGLRAVDLASGATVWGPFLTGEAVMLAYDRGKLFALDVDGHLTAYDALSGVRLWFTQIVTQLDYPSPPVASGGILYLNGVFVGGTVTAIDESNGHELWHVDTAGSGGTVAVGGGVLYDTDACGQASAFDAVTGALNWFKPGNCFGDTGGTTPAIYQDQLWSRDPNLMSGLDGAVRGTFAATAAPSFHGGTGFFVEQGILSAVDLSTNSVKWSFPDPNSSRERLCGSAAIAGRGGQVFAVTSAGLVRELDENTGQPRSAAGDPGGVAFLCNDETAPMAIAASTLLVPVGDKLVAY
jgi:outer membrane protein assembly factor BamB